MKAKKEYSQHFSETIDPILEEVKGELYFACSKFPKFNSTHEGYAVILEELDELWDEIKSKTGTRKSRREEAIQVAAMALRFIKDLGGSP
jgi:hypothetical protein